MSIFKRYFDRVMDNATHASFKGVIASALILLFWVVCALAIVGGVIAIVQLIAFVYTSGVPLVTIIMVGVLILIFMMVLGGS